MVSARRAFSTLTVLSLLVSGASTSAFALEHTRVTYPAALNFEMFGRGLLFDVGLDYMVNDDLMAGIGYGSVGTKNPTTGTDAGTSAMLVPVYTNYYFMRQAGSPFITAGATLVANADDVRGKQSKLGNVLFGDAVVPNVGIGYEMRSDMNYLFRVTGYGMFGDNGFRPWFGFNFGYGF